MQSQQALRVQIPQHNSPYHHHPSPTIKAVQIHVSRRPSEAHATKPRRDDRRRSDAFVLNGRRATHRSSPERHQQASHEKPHGRSSPDDLGPTFDRNHYASIGSQRSASALQDRRVSVHEREKDDRSGSEHSTRKDKRRPSRSRQHGAHDQPRKRDDERSKSRNRSHHDEERSSHSRERDAHVHFEDRDDARKKVRERDHSSEHSDHSTSSHRSGSRSREGRRSSSRFGHTLSPQNPSFSPLEASLRSILTERDLPNRIPDARPQSQTYSPTSSKRALSPTQRPSLQAVLEKPRSRSGEREKESEALALSRAPTSPDHTSPAPISPAGKRSSVRKTIPKFIPVGSEHELQLEFDANEQICTLKKTILDGYHINHLKNQMQESYGRITKLRLDGCHFTKEGLLTLNRFNFLTYLDLSNCIVTEELPSFQDWLKFMTSLKTLKFTSWDRVNLNQLACHALRSLEVLDLSNVRNLRDEDLIGLASAENLSELHISGCNAITDEGLKVCANIPNLNTLIARDCEGITIKGLREFGRLKERKSEQLRVLDLSNSNFQDDLFQNLHSFRSLEALRLVHCPHLTGATLESLPKSVLTIDLSQCAKLSGSNLIKLAETNCRNIIVKRCSLVTQEHIAALLHQCKSLHVTVDSDFNKEVEVLADSLRALSLSPASQTADVAGQSEAQSDAGEGGRRSDSGKKGADATKTYTETYVCNGCVIL
jgi:hypothetical protein